MKQVGLILKESRRKQGLSLEVASKALNIKTSTLQSLENGNGPSLPKNPYLKGFIGAYADFLSIDKNYIMDVFHQEMGLQSEGLRQSDASTKEKDSPHNQIRSNKKIISFFSLLTALFLALALRSLLNSEDPSQTPVQNLAPMTELLGVDPISKTSRTPSARSDVGTNVNLSTNANSKKTLQKKDSLGTPKKAKEVELYKLKKNKTKALPSNINSTTSK